jgi:hypothetical protein
MGLLDVFKPGWKHSNPEKRKQSIEEGLDDDILIEMAINDKDSHIQQMAIRNIRHENNLLPIIDAELDFSIKRSALARIKSEQNIVDIGKKNEDKQVKIWAMDRITDKNAIIDIACQSESEQVIRTAISKIKNNKDLWKTLGKIKVKQIKNTGLSVINDINDEKELTCIVQNALELDIIKTAIEKISDQVLIAQIAVKSQHQTAYKLALEKMTDDQLLAEIAKKSRDVGIQNLALKKIKDNSLAENVSSSQLKAQTTKREEYLKQSVKSAIKDYLHHENGARLLEALKAVGSHDEILAQSDKLEKENRSQLYLDVIRSIKKFDASAWSKIIRKPTKPVRQEFQLSTKAYWQCHRCHQILKKKYTPGELIMNGWSTMDAWSYGRHVDCPHCQYQVTMGAVYTGVYDLSKHDFFILLMLKNAGNAKFDSRIKRWIYKGETIWLETDDIPQTIEELADMFSTRASDKVTDDAEKWFADSSIRKIPPGLQDFDIFQVPSYPLESWMAAVVKTPWDIHCAHIKIVTLGSITSSLFEKLKDYYNLSASDAVDIFNIYLGMACPSCMGGINGEMLQQIESYKKAAGVVMNDGNTDVLRINDGSCASCSSTDYYLLWYGEKKS